MRRLRRTSGALLAATALVAAACGGDADDTAQQEGDTPILDAEESPTTEPAETEADATEAAEGDGEGELGEAAGQSGTDDIEAFVTAPEDGDEVTGEGVTIEFSLEQFDVAPQLAGKTNEGGTGHLHLYLDDSLVDMVFGTSYDLSLRNVEPGTHTVRVVPALNDHTELEGQGDESSFEYDPETPPPFITDADFDGEPEVEITSHEDGDTVSGQFTLEFRVENFELSCELLGKPSVAGYGHWHVNIDNGEGELGGLVDMGCADSIDVSTEGLSPGVHTFYVTLTDNGHAPLGEDTQDAVELVVE